MCRDTNRFPACKGRDAFRYLRPTRVVMPITITIGMSQTDFFFSRQCVAFISIPYVKT